MAPIARYVFAFLSVTVAALALFFLTLPLADALPHMAHYLQAGRWRAYAHMLAGPLVLLLAPLQLSQGLRRRWPGLHRLSGYLYAAGVLLGGAAALTMLPYFQGSRTAAIGFALLAVLWISTTLRGVILARAGNLQAHRLWMARSLAVTFAAVTLRLEMIPLIAAGWTVTETYQITAWSSWGLNLLVVEAWRLRKQNRRRIQGA